MGELDIPGPKETQNEVTFAKTTEELIFGKDSNFSIFRVQRFTDWPQTSTLNCFPVESLTKRLIH